jgi:hypothetical protein
MAVRKCHSAICPLTCEFTAKVALRAGRVVAPVSKVQTQYRPPATPHPCRRGVRTDGPERHRVVEALTILISLAAASTSKPASNQPTTFSTCPVLSLVNVSTAPLARNRQTTNSRATRNSFGMEPTVRLSTHTTAGLIDWGRLLCLLYSETCASVPPDRRPAQPPQRAASRASGSTGCGSARHVGCFT